MTEVSALGKFSCPGCGAAAEWSPASQALLCPYCGTVSPAELAADGSLVREHELSGQLRKLQEEAGGWEADRHSVQCQSCKAITLFNPAKVAQRCDFCGSPAVVPYAETRAPIVPESVLPFKLDEPAVRDSIRRWYASRWFAPNRLKRAAYTDTVRGIYLPYWTFDKDVSADWTAEAGYYYYVTKTVRDTNGRTRNVQERRTRWESAAGHLDHFFDDEIVPASCGVRHDLLAGIAPFPAKEVVPYDPGYVSGWEVEQYQIDLVSAAVSARETILARTRTLCSQQVPGDTQRNLQVNAAFRSETFKHILVPVWLLHYDYGRKSYQVVLNGCTGAIAGDRPYSWVKIALAILAALVAVLVFLHLSGATQ